MLSSGADDTFRPLAKTKFRTISERCEKVNDIHYDDSNGESMPNGDPTVFGFPCHFPAAPSIPPKNCAQHIDRK
jgi:hypothetical protein